MLTMAPSTTNRYALFAADDEPTSPQSPSGPPLRARNINRPADNGAPGKQTKRSSQWKTLVIKEENKPLKAGNEHDQSRHSSLSARESHEKADNSREHWCGACYIKFSSKTNLLQHIKQAPGHENYCNLCKRVFKDRNGLQNHVDNSFGHDIHCNLCLSAFKDEWGLKDHFKNKIAASHEFVCFVCLVGFKSHNALEKHLQTGDKHVWCHTCHRKFGTQKERDEHWSNTARHKHCLQPGCDFDAQSVDMLEKHLRDDHFRCEGCKTVFPSQSKLAQHFVSCRSALKCGQCGRAYAGQAKLAEHSRKCFKCEHCGFLAEQKDIHQAHMSKHVLPMRIECWACSKPMQSQTALLTHLESGHCIAFRDTSPLLSCLGSFWHSVVYMDLDLHGHIRRNEVDIGLTTSWVKEGMLQPFICRADKCHKTFSFLNELMKHVQEADCAWGLEILRLDLLEEEFKNTCVRKSVTTA